MCDLVDRPPPRRPQLDRDPLPTKRLASSAGSNGRPAIGSGEASAASARTACTLALAAAGRGQGGWQRRGVGAGGRGRPRSPAPLELRSTRSFSWHAVARCGAPRCPARSAQGRSVGRPRDEPGRAVVDPQPVAFPPSAISTRMPRLRSGATASRRWGEHRRLQGGAGGFVEWPRANRPGSPSASGTCPWCREPGLVRGRWRGAVARGAAGGTRVQPRRRKPPAQRPPSATGSSGVALDEDRHGSALPPRSDGADGACRRPGEIRRGPRMPLRPHRA